MTGRTAPCRAVTNTERLVLAGTQSLSTHPSSQLMTTSYAQLGVRTRLSPVSVPR